MQKHKQKFNHRHTDLLNDQAKSQNERKYSEKKEDRESNGWKTEKWRNKTNDEWIETAKSEMRMVAE